MFIFSLEAGSPRSRCWKVWFLTRTFLLSFCVLTWKRGRELVSSSSYKGSNPSWGPTLTISSKPDCLLKPPLHSPSFQGLGVQYTRLTEDKIQSPALSWKERQGRPDSPLQMVAPCQPLSEAQELCG